MHRILILVFIITTAVCTVGFEIEDILKFRIRNVSVFEIINSTKENILNFVEEQCEENSGGTKVFETLKLLPLELNSCIEPIFNYTVIVEEFEESKKKGAMDEVFWKYCERFSEIFKCFEEAKKHLYSCLNLVEQKIVEHILVSLIPFKNFMCANEGDRIAMFVAKGGFECIKSRFDKLLNCFNHTSLENVRALTTTPNFSATEKNCSDVAQTRNCFYEIMLTCEDSSPANIVEAVFKFFKNKLGCKDNAHVLFLDYWNWHNTDMYQRIALILIVLILSFILLKCIQNIRVRFYERLQ